MSWWVGFFKFEDGTRTAEMTQAPTAKEACRQFRSMKWEACYPTFTCWDGPYETRQEAQENCRTGCEYFS